jgi:hypothetical protein
LLYRSCIGDGGNKSAWNQSEYKVLRSSWALDPDFNNYQFYKLGFGNMPVWKNLEIRRALFD